MYIIGIINTNGDLFSNIVLIADIFNFKISKKSSFYAEVLLIEYVDDDGV